MLIPAAIDQDPYWRITRDVAEKMGFYKPAQIHSKFLPSLNATGGKMSSSKPETAVFTTDEPEVIEKSVQCIYRRTGYCCVAEALRWKRIGMSSFLVFKVFL